MDSSNPMRRGGGRGRIRGADAATVADD